MPRHPGRNEVESRDRGAQTGKVPPSRSRIALAAVRDDGAQALEEDGGDVAERRDKARQDPEAGPDASNAFSISGMRRSASDCGLSGPMCL